MLLDFLVVDDVVSGQSVEDVVGCQVHCVVMVPEVAWRLHVLISVDLCIGYVPGLNWPKLCCQVILESTTCIVFCITERLKAEAQCSLLSYPTGGITIESWPDFQAMEMSDHGDIFDGHNIVLIECVIQCLVSWAQIST